MLEVKESPHLDQVEAIGFIQADAHDRPPTHRHMCCQSPRLAIYICLKKMNLFIFAGARDLRLCRILKWSSSWFPQTADFYLMNRTLRNPHPRRPMAGYLFSSSSRARNVISFGFSPRVNTRRETPAGTVLAILS